MTRLADITVERRLTTVLAAWSALSVLGGGVLALRPDTRRFGRQTAAWGAVDGLVAVLGTAGRRSRGPTDPDRLRRVLRVNLALDVGYVVGGLALLTPPPVRRGWRQDGVAVAVQGLFLLVLDGWAERALSRQARVEGREPGRAGRVVA